MEVQINYLAVLLAAISSMVVSAAWYAKLAFGKEWQKLAKLTDKQMREGSLFALVIVFLSSVVMALVLAYFTYLLHWFYGNSFLQDALVTGAWVWVGFQGLRIFMYDQFEQRRKKLTAINAGNELVTIMVMALIIGLIKL